MLKHITYNSVWFEHILQCFHEYTFDVRYPRIYLYSCKENRSFSNQDNSTWFRVTILSFSRAKILHIIKSILKL